jgi:hypothetical protein
MTFYFTYTQSTNDIAYMDAGTWVMSGKITRACMGSYLSKNLIKKAALSGFFI